MHGEILQAFTRRLRPWRRQLAVGQRILHDLAQHLYLLAVDQAPQFADIARLGCIDGANQQYIACIDSGVDEVDGAAHGIAVPGGPFGNVHPAIARQAAHVSIQYSQRCRFNDGSTQDAGAGKDTQVDIVLAQQLHGFGGVNGIDLNRRDSLALAELQHRLGDLKAVIVCGLCAPTSLDNAG